MHQFKFIVPGHIISDTVRNNLKDAQKRCDQVYPHGKMCQFGRPWVKNLKTGLVAATRVKGKWLEGDKRHLIDATEERAGNGCRYPDDCGHQCDV